MAGLDANPYLIGFDNGVFDLEHSKFHPRGSVPVDMLVSMTTGYDYVGAADGTPVDDAQAAKMEELERAVYDKIFPHAATRLCVQDVLGACLIGGSGITNKLFLFVGERGNNAKTAFTSWLIKATLGDYYGTLNFNILTDTRDKADARIRSGLMQNQKRKLVVLNEGINSAPIVASWMKALTGGDDLVYRNKYSAAEAAPFFPKLVVVRNSVPNRSADDFVNHRAYCPIDFISVFDATAKQDDPVNFVWKAQNHLHLRTYYQEQAPLHMLLMLKYARRFIQNGHRLPAVPDCSASKQEIDMLGRGF
jgi:phage/plasmid-associated DNA primase